MIRKIGIIMTLFYNETCTFAIMKVVQIIQDTDGDEDNDCSEGKIMTL